MGIDEVPLPISLIVLELTNIELFFSCRIIHAKAIKLFILDLALIRIFSLAEINDSEA